MSEGPSNARNVYRPPRGRASQHQLRDRNTSRLNTGGSANEFRKPPLTHFLSIPLGHIPELRSAVSSFTSALLLSDPAIPGLEESIIIQARRLHLTLGVMSLTETEALASSREDTNATDDDSSQKTLGSAIELLRSIQPRAKEILNGESLRVPLTMLDIMKPDQNDTTRAHVCFAGPSKADLQTNDGKNLLALCQLINSEFHRAGFLVDKRPLKLHCTILNTTHRQPKPRGKYGKRVPFSYAAIQESRALQTILQTSAESKDGKEEGPRAEIGVNLGTYGVGEIQICRMGSRGPEGEYVCVGKILL